MKAVQDFNYKVALASGLKHLQAGKLRQAEEQFRYLVSKFPGADGGYRGLARVQVELGDRSAALASLRDGAAALSRAGERTVAIDLLREATGLDPLDLSAHRRLAATLALVGDVGASAEEYVRFANAEIAAGDPDRARLEASYALETLGEIAALHELARTVGLELRTVRRLAAEPEVAAPDVEPEPVVETASSQPPADVLADGPPDVAWTEPPASAPLPPWARSEPAQDPRLAAAAAWAASRPASRQEHPAPAEPWATTESAATEPAAAEPAAAAPASAVPAAAGTAPAHAQPLPPAPEPPAAAAPRVDVFALEAEAMSLLATGDPDAGRVAIEAARALAGAGKVHAASDLLLQLVASGIAVHDAERELVGVAHALGRAEIAAEREQLLITVTRLG